jgi:hypothetical protein
MPETTNALVVTRLREVADLLEQQGANAFRVSAYRRATSTVLALEDDLIEIYTRGGLDALTALPGIGISIASAIQEMIRTGRWGQLERLRGLAEPEVLFQSIPGVGKSLARQLHQILEVDTLEALEVAAHDERLETVPGVGPRRSAMIRASLADILRQGRPRLPVPSREPSVDLLLDVDRNYRAQAQSDRLPRIAPRRFNPAGEAWLPVLHAERDSWQFTALYSNTARAHELGRVRDWVVIYFHTDVDVEDQRAVVTETRGPLEEKRVVRGLEADCRSYYARRGDGEGI